MNEKQNKSIVAKFIGKDSCGFIHGNLYQLRSRCQRVGLVECLCIYDTQSKAWCPYTTLEKFLENWKLM